MTMTIRFWILIKSFWQSKKTAKSLGTIVSSFNAPKSTIQNPQFNQSGAALIGLLALMAIVALLLLAAAPSVNQQIQRERELEAIRRGNEIAEAIRIFAQINGRLPKNMDDLLEGVQIRGRTKKLMILRASAAKDPLSSSGEWKLVQDNDFKTLANFQSKISRYTGSTAFTNPPPQVIFEQVTRGVISTVIDIETSEETDPPGGEDDSANIDSPFVGVTSRAQTKSVLTFYGIERHDWWVFTPLFRGAVIAQQIRPNTPPTPPETETNNPLPPPPTP